MPELFLILALSANVILFLVSVPTLGLLVIRYYQTRVAQILPLLGFMILSIYVSLHFSLAYVSSEKEIETFYGPGALILSTFSFLLFAFFLAGLTRNSVFCRETALALFLGGIIIGLVWKEGLVTAAHEEGIWFFKTDPLLAVFQIPFLLFIGFWGIKVLKKTREFAVTEKQEHQQWLFTYGLIIIFFVGPLVTIAIAIPLYWLPEYQDLGSIIGIMSTVIFSTVGLVCLAIIYGRNKEPIYLQPQQLYSLIVIQSTGLPLFTFQFKRGGSAEDDVDPGLTAAALTAITSFLREAVGSTEEFREIVTADRIVLAKAGEGFFSVLVSERASSFVHLALTQFTAIFARDYGQQVEKFAGNLDDFRDAERVVSSAFGME
ncbi:MAG: hypothetical protein ACFFB3_18680 [Candidatus Hodarchaeota archaeon]